ncbi:arsenic resistance N-acetyltransferase ArsN2 [Natrinema gelatinilyticum]|uniref:arsenic resistance N-acetyltransferase ArsN2 n=1 Tax=Natrinema gelatinilyticum TaxID=2961571 RepID=UPI0020C586C3|nr:arsenic resistance N-acetyltransferase ArsN2 [Natrinema gelatinilyticum]
MTTTSLTLQRADGDDIERIKSVLDANELPSQDVRDTEPCFFLAYANTECVGTGGVEIHGSNGLLRSVVITESNRGQGYGAALCDSLEEYARTNGVETLYLLTTTAAPFFRRRGYGAVTREDVPKPIRGTTQFTDLCPASATCMAKDLET